MKKNNKQQNNNSKFLKIIGVFLALFVFLVFLNSLNLTGQAFKTTGLLYVSSTPKDANIFIDDVPYGLTNKEIRLNEGTYTLRIEKRGYITYQEVLYLKAGVRERVLVSMVRE